MNQNHKIQIFEKTDQHYFYRNCQISQYDN